MFYNKSEKLLRLVLYFFIVFQVQQLREEIQKSHAVRFALDVYSALDKKNYVKFFKLVNSTTYLNACILMRYFVQVRTTALQFLLKCYAPRATKTLYPLNELTNILCFDDIESAIDFTQFYRLPENEEKTHIILDKSTFAIPEIPYVLDRSYNVVEYKRIHSVGKVVCGKDLPPSTFHNHIPQNSFDAKGYLISKDFLEEAELQQASKQLIYELEEQPDEIDSSPNIIFPLKEETRSPMLMMNDSAKSILNKPTIISSNSKDSKEIFQQPSGVTSSNIFSYAVQKSFGSSPLVKMPMNFSGAQINANHKQDTSIFAPQQTSRFSTEASSFFGSSIQQQKEVPKVNENQKGGFSFNLIQSEKSEETFANNDVLPVKSISSQIVFNSSQDSSNNHINVKNDDVNLFQRDENNINSEVGRNLTSELSQIGNIKKRESHDKVLTERSIKGDIDICNILTTVNEPRELELNTKRLKEEQKRHDEERKRHELKKQEKLLNKEMRTAVKLTLNSIVAEVDRKITYEKVLLFRRKMKDAKTLKVIHRWRNFTLNHRKRKAMDYSPVWVDSNTSIQTANELFNTPSRNITLSLMKRYKRGKPVDIELPEDEEITKINMFELTYRTLKNRYFNLIGTIQKSIYWKVVISMPDEHELLNGAQRIEDTMEEAFQWQSDNFVIEQINVNSVESVTYCVEKQKGLEVPESDANGIIFIAKNFNTILQRRIFEHLKAFGVLTKVPIVIILQEYDEHECKLRALQEAKILSDYIILIDHLTPHALLNSVEEGLVFLAGKIEMSPPLELDTFSSFIKKWLCSEMWKKANSFAKWNSQYKTCLRDPNIVIGLYNEALGKLTQIIRDRSSKEYINFPEIFKEYLMTDIPHYLPCGYQFFPKFWKSEFYIYHLEKMLKKLSLQKWQEKWPPTTEFELEVNMAKYCTKAFKAPEKAFYKIMALLLQDVDPNINFEDVGCVLWTNIIQLLGLEKLNELNLSLISTDFESKSLFNQYIVVYNREIIEKYSRSDWFYINNPIITRRFNQLMQLEKKTIPEHKLLYTSLVDINETIKEATKKLDKKSFNFELHKEINDFKVLLSDLETSISIHKKINSKMGEELKKCIDDN